jgi:hypothetical protein
MSSISSSAFIGAIFFSLGAAIEPTALDVLMDQDMTSALTDLKAADFSSYPCLGVFA